ncbi:LptA/OstA family protein [Prosthecobacter sp.]|uniref:LptA/OstA family protein n=1 Tax=Prosthecobacter sp. TaxID=1965333 RepID=UPI003782EA5F
MKTSSIIRTVLLLSCAGALAQGPGGTRPLLDFRKKKVDPDTKAKALDAAKDAVKKVPDEIKEKAKEMLLSPEGAEMRQKALQAAQSVMQGNAGSGTGTATATPATPADAPPATAPTPAPAPAVAVVEAPPAPPKPTGPQPKPLQPLNLDEAPKATKGQIDITAQKHSYFDTNTNYAIFTGDVKARHPNMYIECEELEIFMTKQQGGVLGSAPKPKKPAPSVKDSDILAKPSKEAANTDPPIDKADARGPMVTIEKISEDGELQIGHCKHLIYDGKTKKTTLMEWPQVQAGNQLLKATEAGCVIEIDRNGKLTTTGNHETLILQGDDATPRRSGGLSSPSPSPQ